MHNISKAISYKNRNFVYFNNIFKKNEYFLLYDRFKSPSS